MADYVKRSTTGLQEANATETSAGAGDAGKLPKLNSSGKLDSSMLPAGIGDETTVAPATENLSAGDLVNFWDDAGTLSVRKADASNGRRAHGFVEASVTSGNNATVYGAGYINNSVTGLTPSATYYLSAGTAGAVATAGPASAASHIHQEVGVATSATSLLFVPKDPIALIA